MTDDVERLRAADERMKVAKAQFSRAAQAVLDNEALADDLVWFALAELEAARVALRNLDT